MRANRSASTSVTTVISLAFLYLIVVAFTVVLSRQLLTQGEAQFQQLLLLFAGLGVLFPLVLLGFVGVNVFRLLREYRQRRPGSTFKGRLSLFFSVLAILVAVPQGIVAVTFLSSALELIFTTGAADAVSRGLDITLAYYDRDVSDLERLASDGTLVRIFSGTLDRAAIDQALQARLHRPAAVQVSSLTGEEELFIGDVRLRQENIVPDGIGAAAEVVRLTVDELPLLRLRTLVDSRPRRIVMITTELPRGFEETARILTNARHGVRWLEQQRPTILLTLGLVYAVFMAPILLIAILISFILSDKIMQPIQSLEEATHRIAQGDYTVRILARPNDDLQLLVLSFNNMVNKLDSARRRMVQSEKLQAWQEIAQRLAHEVKNPLTPIRLAAERLRRRYHLGGDDFPQVLDRTVETIIGEVDTLTTLLDEFRSFARMPQPQMEWVNLSGEIATALSVFSEDPGLTLDTAAIDPRQQLWVDPQAFRRILLNLVTNASEAGSGVAHIRLTGDIIQKNGEPYFRLRVEDDGPGIPPELGARIFDPYITTKSAGTGLGLAIVERIVFDHDGAIRCESAPGSGTTFIIDFPVRNNHGNHIDR
jgi:two-component system nitrogen regulation sensor histidine kinase NtrY